MIENINVNELLELENTNNNYNDFTDIIQSFNDGIISSFHGVLIA